MDYIEVQHESLIGRTKRKLDFLGYHFSPEGLTIAQKALYNFVERAIRLYEQGPGEPCGSARLGEHPERWVGWVEPINYSVTNRLPNLGSKF